MTMEVVFEMVFLALWVKKMRRGKDGGLFGWISAGGEKDLRNRREEAKEDGEKIAQGKKDVTELLEE